MTQNLVDADMAGVEKRPARRPEALTAPYAGQSSAVARKERSKEVLSRFDREAKIEERGHVKALRAKGHSGPMYDVNEPVPPSQRHKFRTKGTPFSRVKLVEVVPGKRGVPAKFRYRHLTRSVERTVTATPETIGYFTGGNLPFHMATELLGGL